MSDLASTLYDEFIRFSKSKLRRQLTKPFSAICCCVQLGSFRLRVPVQNALTKPNTQHFRGKVNLEQVANQPAFSFLTINLDWFKLSRMRHAMAVFHGLYDQGDCTAHGHYWFLGEKSSMCQLRFLFNAGLYARISFRQAAVVWIFRNRDPMVCPYRCEVNE